MQIKKLSEYLEDYGVKGDGAAKKLIYEGDYYASALSDAAFLRYKRLLLLFAGLCVLFYVAATLLDPSALRGKGAVYVIVPYVLLCLAGGMGILRLLRLYRLPNRLERKDYERCVSGLSMLTLVVLLLSAGVWLGQTVYIFLHKCYTLREFLCCGCFLALAVTAGLSDRLQRGYSWRNIGKNPSGSD